ncbi:unnamed protein product [Albugo candida]|uniref:Uncharacterized protein n=1 Tax=Albugo candida TaxID=65357 RepID=A0A024GN40_9STRA|nr:unnamed protein product [Albugo candida]|eukprot:CCI48145.1 unnamed protein product [Albugo candida]
MAAVLFRTSQTLKLKKICWKRQSPRGDISSYFTPNFIRNFFGGSKMIRKEKLRLHMEWIGRDSFESTCLSFESTCLSFARTILRHARKSFLFMDVYRKDLTGKAAEYALKKYRSHRRVPDSVHRDSNALVATV